MNHYVCDNQRCPNRDGPDPSRIARAGVDVAMESDITLMDGTVKREWLDVPPPNCPECGDKMRPVGMRRRQA